MACSLRAFFCCQTVDTSRFLCYNYLKRGEGCVFMYLLLNSLLSDKSGGITFKCFGIWHLLYVLAAVAAVIAAIFYLKNKDIKSRKAVINGSINIAFGLYVADFFLMPLAYGEIDIEKLPFHVCTATCVLCFLSRRLPALEKYSSHTALLGFISNLVYLIYPAGVMWYGVHPLSYRVLQTLLFHGVMTVYGVLTLIFERDKLSLKAAHADLILLAIITLWAILGNAVYNGESEGYKHFFNWFFVVRDPFYILPEGIAPFVMPPLNIALFFTAELAVYGIIRLSEWACGRRAR